MSWCGRCGAEPLYRRALEIKERRGDHAGVATSYAALAGLSEAVGNPDKAVVYRVTSLAIRLNIGTATAGDAQALAGLRSRLGSDRFRSALPSDMDEESVGNLMQMLDQQKGKTAGDDPAPTGTTESERHATAVRPRRHYVGEQVTVPQPWIWNRSPVRPT